MVTEIVTKYKNDTIKTLRIVDEIKPIDTQYLLYNCEKLTNIENIQNINTPRAKTNC